MNVKAFLIFNWSFLILKILWWFFQGCSPLPIPNREVKPLMADGTAQQCGRVGSCHILLNQPLHLFVKAFFMAFSFGRLTSITIFHTHSFCTSAISQQSGLNQNFFYFLTFLRWILREFISGKLTSPVIFIELVIQNTTRFFPHALMNILLLQSSVRLFLQITLLALQPLIIKPILSAFISTSIILLHEPKNLALLTAYGRQ